MAKSLLFRLMTKGSRIHKSWKNVYALRQEYNKYQKCWFPVIFYWNTDGSRSWIEALCTDTGNSFYHGEASLDYSAVTRSGTSKCDPEHVKAIIAEYQSECDESDPCGPVIEVKKLMAYRPKATSGLG